MARDYDVFISYNSEDNFNGSNFKKLLELLGLKVWFDVDDINAGGRLTKAISDGIKSSLNCVVLFGKHGLGKWQTDEIDIALNKQKRETHFNVISVILPNVDKEPEIPDFLSIKLVIDLTKDFSGGLAKLLVALGVNPSRPLLYDKREEARLFEVDRNNIKDGRNFESLPAGYTADVSKVVKLLIGESLYSKRDVFIRELVQNAVDACERRKALQRVYNPSVKVDINTEEGWFEVQDNGEGMDPYLLKNSFAVIGKSIRDESYVVDMLDEERLHLIAKFGIGFASTFMASKKICISTKYENARQINLSITEFDERFSYTDESECERDPNVTGTTVRVFLKEDALMEFDILDTLVRYVRHVPYCTVMQDGEEIVLNNDDWNVNSAIVSEVRNTNDYELHWGACLDEGTIIASNWGFFVTEDPDPITPYFIPSWIAGEIGFFPGRVDLNLARDAIVDNQKAKKIKDELRGRFEVLLAKIIDEINVEFADSEKNENDNDEEDGYSNRYQRREIKELRGKVKDLVVTYNYYTRNEDELQKIGDRPPLSMEETNGMVLDLFKFEYEKKDFSLRRIIKKLKEKNIDRVYYSDWSDQYRSYTSFLIDYLEGKGYLVFHQNSIKVLFRGSNVGQTDIYLTTLINPIIQELGFSVNGISAVPLEEVDGLRVDPASLPETLKAALNSLNMAGKTPIPINLPNAELAFERNSKWYINIAHNAYKRLVNWADLATPQEIRIYMKGLFRIEVF